MLRHFLWVGGFAALAIVLSAGGAGADQPQPWQMGMQEAASPVAERIHVLNAVLLWACIIISGVVLVLMGFIAVRFRAKRNPVPSKTAHNTLLEILWTAAPILILVVIAVPSLRLLYFMDRNHDPEMTIKVVGHQWYWSYEYPDHGEFTFDSLMLQDDELQPGQPRLLAVDNPVVLPVGTDIQLLLTATDVIHSWAVPALGLKTDTVPGRISESWVRIDRAGTYYGQCSELCGVNHAYMPIAIKAVSREEFAAWVETAKAQFAAADKPAPRVARTERR